MEISESQASKAYAKIQSLLEFGNDVDMIAEAVGDEPNTPHVSQTLSDMNLGDNMSLSLDVMQTPSVVITTHHPVNDLSKRITEETFEQQFHPNERNYHTLLQHTMQEYGDSQGIGGVIASDMFHQAELAGRYANVVQDAYVKLCQEARRYGTGAEGGVGGGSYLVSNQYINDRKSALLQREMREQRAERDLWALLEILTASNLLYDIDNDSCAANLQSAMDALPITASIPEYINAAFLADDRLKKGAVLREWVEKAAVDQVSETPAPRAGPMGDTLARLLQQQNRPVSREGLGDYYSNSASITARSQQGSSGKKEVSSMHPDAQITAEGLVLPLDGSDRIDQECLFKTIWQLIRCGNVVRAQQLAADHGIYWLAASLQGIASHSYRDVTAPSNGTFSSSNSSRGGGGGSNYNNRNQEEEEEEEAVVVGVARIGNVKQPIWVRSCWKHAARLAGNQENWNSQLDKIGSDGRSVGMGNRALRANQREDSLAGVLEMSIYAALSNHTKVLMDSPMVHSWSDRVWVYLKATHERDLANIVHRYRCVKAAHSAYYPGCGDDEIAAERELLYLNKAEIAHMSTGTCVQIFNKVPPPDLQSLSSSSSAASVTAAAGAFVDRGPPSTEALILHLQAAVMEGRSGIQFYVENTMLPTLQYYQQQRSKHQLSHHHYHHSHTTASAATISSGGQGEELVLRLFCHFCIWCKYAHPNDRAELSELVSLPTLYLSLECYIDHLIATKQRTLVATYAAYLSRPRRIHKYAQLLRSMQTSPSSSTSLVSLGQSTTSTSSSSGDDAAEVLQLAKLYFPQDVMDITRSVVETSATPSKTKFVSAATATGTSTGTGVGHSAVHYGIEDEEEIDGDTSGLSLTAAGEDASAVDAAGDDGRLRLPTSASTTSASLRAASSISATGSARRAGKTGLLSPRPMRGTVAAAQQTQQQQQQQLQQLQGGASFLISTTATTNPHTPLRRPNPAATRATIGAGTGTVIVDDWDEGEEEGEEGGTVQQQMEALRWLFFDPAHRMEAVKQANRMIVSFLLSTRPSSDSGGGSGGGDDVPRRSLGKLSAVRRLLADYVSPDSVAMGYEHLQQRIDGVEQLEREFQQAQAAASFPASGPTEEQAQQLHQLQRELAVEKDLWAAQVAKFELWKSLCAALQDVDLFHRSVQEYHAAAARLLGSAQVIQASLGRFRARIVRAAQVATDSLLRAIICADPSSSSSTSSVSTAAVSTARSAGGDVGSGGGGGHKRGVGQRDGEEVDFNLAPTPASGYKNIWELGEKAAEDCTSLTVEDVMFKLDEFLVNQENVEYPDEGINSIGWGEINKSIGELWEVSRSLYGPNVQNPKKDTAATANCTAVSAEQQHPVLQAVMKLVQLPLPVVDSPSADNQDASTAVVAGRKHQQQQQHQQEQEASAAAAAAAGIAVNTGISDAAMSIVSLLRHCTAYLVDVQECGQLAGRLLFYLLSSYQHICSTVATILQSLAPDHTRDIAYWYTRSMKLADLIATEDVSLQLYTMLHRNDLESLLSNINAAAMSLLAVDPTMSELHFKK